MAQGVLEQGRVPECGKNDAAFHIEIARPAPTVSLGRVPDIVLHAQMCCVGRGFPDAIKLDVRGFKRAFKLYWVHDGLSMNAKRCGAGTPQKTNSHITKCR